MIDNDIKKIDLVVLNLYAFEDTVAKGYGFETCIEISISVVLPCCVLLQRIMQLFAYALLLISMLL